MNVDKSFWNFNSMVIYFANILIFPQSIQVKNKPTVLRIKKCLKMFLTCILFPYNTWKKTGGKSL